MFRFIFFFEMLSKLSHFFNTQSFWIFKSHSKLAFYAKQKTPFFTLSFMNLHEQYSNTYHWKIRKCYSTPFILFFLFFHFFLTEYFFFTFLYFIHVWQEILDFGLQIGTFTVPGLRSSGFCRIWLVLHGAATDFGRDLAL